MAIAVCLIVTIYRLKMSAFTQSALSSQFLESNRLLWGSLPWHIGIGAILLAHLFVLLFPEFWARLMSDQRMLYVAEAAGIGLGALALAGLAVLFVRRITSAKLRKVTSTMDLVILMLLAVQVVSGLLTAGAYRWGASWSTATAVPYVWSLLTFHPDASYVTAMPAVIKIHIIGAWLLLLLIPFSRLIHLFTLPLAYLWRAPQKVIWSDRRRLDVQPGLAEQEEARRHFLRGAIGLTGGGLLLAIGAADKLVRFFFGPRLSQKESAELMAKRLKRLEQTVEHQKLELERQQNDFIFVSKISGLSQTKGKYFIDYNMWPALAFKDSDGMPLLISAKCTHLGCTVGSDVQNGKVLCPCHISHFDIHTGAPNRDSPARAPLPHIGWVIMDRQGKLVASKAGSGPVKGRLDRDRMESYSVFIARHQQEGA